MSADVQPAVPHQLGDGYDMHVVAQQIGVEGVPDDVRGGGRAPVVAAQVVVGGQGVK